MTEFPSDQDPIDPEQYPEVIIPDRTPDSPDATKGSPKNLDLETVSKEETKKTDAGKPERQPIKFKKRSEAIPLETPPLPRRSRSRSSSSSSGELFADDEAVSEFRNLLAKPVIVIVGLFWLLGILYLLKLGWDKANQNATVSNETTVVEGNNVPEPAVATDVYNNLKEKLQEADELLAKSQDIGSLKRGALLKLQALIDWNVLDLSRARQDMVMNSELVRATRRYIGNQDEAINARSQLGLMLLQINEYLKSPNRESWPEVSKRFDELLVSEAKHPGNSENYLRIAGSLAHRGLDFESQQLYTLINDRFSDSSTENLASIGSQAANYIRSPIEIAQVATETAQQDDSAQIPIEIAASDRAPNLEQTADVASPGFDSEQKQIADQGTISDNLPDVEVPGLDPAAVAQTSESSDVSTIAQPESGAPTQPAFEMEQHPTIESDVVQSEDLVVDKNESIVNEPSNVEDVRDSESAEQQIVAANESNGAQDISDSEPTDSQIEGVLQDSREDKMTLPIEAAPDEAVTDSEANEYEPAVEIALGPIEPANEPDSFVEDSIPLLSEPGTESVINDREGVESSALKNRLPEPESGAEVEDFLADGESNKQENNEAVFDEMVNDDADVKSESQVEPNLEVEPEISLAEPEEDLQQDPNTFHDPIDAAPADPRNSEPRNVRPESAEIAQTKYQEHLGQIRIEVDSNSVSTETLNAAIEFSDYLIESNSIAAAGSLLGAIAGAVDLVEDTSQQNQLRDKYYSSKKRFDYFGKTFETTGLYDLDGNAIQVDRSSRELKLVVFWSINSQTSTRLIRQIERLKDEFSSRRVRVVAVCDVSSPDGLAQVQQLASENGFIEFYQLKPEDPASRMLAERFPIRKYPYLLMLSADNKVAGINVDPVFFDPIGR